MSQEKCPVEEGQELELFCISKGSKGDGVFKHEGFIIIVPEAEIDHRYIIKITAVRSKVAFGRVIEEV